jgi:hypothetical protein
MTKPTLKKIQAEIAALEELQPKIRPTTAFGDSNTDAVAAQIEVLEKRMDDDDVADKEDSGDWNQFVASSARDAVLWLEGQSEEETLSSGWESLVKK